MASLALTLTAPQAAALSEAEAVQRGMNHPDVRARFDARREAAAGLAQAAGRWRNPELELSRERLGLPGGTGTERSAWLVQRWNVAGVAGLEREAARRMRAAQNARLELEARELAAEIRRDFYEARAAEAEAAAVRAWQQRLGELAEAVAARIAAGDAAEYDRLRLERERDLVRSELLEAEQRAATAHDRLFSLIGGARAELQGQLLPSAPPQRTPEQVLQEHPLIDALAAESDSAALEANASARRRWPEITLGVGRRELSEPGIEATGNQLLLGIEIPLFDRGEGQRRAAEGRERALQAQRRRAESRLAAEVRAAARAMEARLEAARGLQRGNEGESGSLIAIAELAYDAGEIGIMELIDAHSTELELRRAAIAKALDARHARIELQRLAGD